MNKIDFTDFEKELMDKLLDGDDIVLAILRKQFQDSSIKFRKDTGVGFYLTFYIPNDLPPIFDEVPLCKPNFCFGDVKAHIQGLRNGAGFLIWVKNGYLDQLEGYTYDEKWIHEIKSFKLNYLTGKRDILSLHKIWLIDDK
jgi:hypothetical protein